ncbi:MAG: transcription elongation factor GreA [Candidatus Magasanikbacteria bacterium]|nr:transcription elongation factor GreA [Candidatus Magasanikbacteria bacterium]
MKKPINLRLTPEGFQNLLNEQKTLTESRPGVLKAMVEAREQGDLSENAGYHAAKEKLGYIDSRLRSLKLMIRFADVVKGEDSKNVTFGNTVVIEGPDGQKTFTIVSAMEADPKEGKMSDISPIGMALLNKKVGDTIEIDIPDGKVSFRIVDVKT